MPAASKPYWRSLLLAALATAVLAGCQESTVPKQLKPVPSALRERMKQLNMSETGPVFIRIFKESSELEVWKKQRDGKYALLKNYAICKWSGDLGPKVAEGDRQAPEGFYTVTPAQMNPKSSYYLAFNIGFPNAFDRSHGRTGSHLMVHGACSSAGCYSMTDEDAGELFALARDAFRGGQRAFQIQAFPFRMTPENMAKHRESPHFAFWQMLKTGSDHFEVTRVPPKVDVCGRHYVFNAEADGGFSPAATCPRYEIPEPIKTAVDAKQLADKTKFAEAIDDMKAEATRVAEEKKKAEEERVAQAEKAAARAAKTAELAKKLGVFGRLLNRDGGTRGSEEGNTGSAATGTDSTPVTAFAPTPPVPPKRPATAPEATASIKPPAPEATPSPPVEVPIADTKTKATITPEVGRFVKKPFLWPGGG